MKAIITTTLYRLRKHHACKDRYDHLVSKLGPEWGDQQPINLRKILRYNGIADCLWAFRAVTKHPEGDQVMRLMAADFAEAVLPIYESKYSLDDRPRRAIQAARDYANGKITAKKRVAAGAVARTAARAAADAATWAAARATGAATRATAWVAAEAAAGAATMAAIKAIKEATGATTRDAAEDVQVGIIRKYLCA